MKLSKAQQKVMDYVIKEYEHAKYHNYYEWFRYEHGARWTNDDADRLDERLTYNNARNGIIQVMCNSKTLYKLQEYGLITILNDANGETYGIDKIQLCYAQNR